VTSYYCWYACDSVQAVDGDLGPATSCVYFYGVIYARETLSIVERVEKDDATVSWT